jgi:Superfamily II helicase
MRIRDGIKEELLGLVSLSSVGRVRARALYNAGYRSLEDLRTAKIKELSNIKGIDVKIASSILRQLNGEIEDQ